MPLFTFLVKSVKYGGICLACLDDKKRWIRPIKAGGFTEKDIIMDNGEMMQIFDVVDTELGPPLPIKHHTENMKFIPGIKFVKKLSQAEQGTLLADAANAQLLKKVESKYELYEEITASGQSIVLAGPIEEFGIQYNCGDHPQIWIVKQSNTLFYIPCTDFKFCKFVKNIFDNSIGNQNYVSARDIAELKDKQIYFVIGLTGDSLKENGEIKDGRYTPDENSIPKRYWPMVVSVLTVPNYSYED